MHSTDEIAACKRERSVWTSIVEIAVEIAKEEIRITSSAYNLLLERDRKKYINDLTKQMMEMAKNLEFEKAALLRDEIQRIKERKDLEG